jgi:putative acetyltransferase
MESVSTVQVISEEDIQLARDLFLEYQHAIGIDLCFQNFDEELRSLPGEYAPPPGRLLLCFDSQELAGCIALRRIDEMICEMKRLYVRPAFRGKHIGRFLAETIVHHARGAGYTKMRLDTLATMTEAIALYKALGFSAIAPYRPNPLPTALYFELDLTRP